MIYRFPLFESSPFLLGHNRVVKLCRGHSAYVELRPAGVTSVCLRRSTQAVVIFRKLTRYTDTLSTCVLMPPCSSLIDVMYLPYATLA